MEFLDFGAGQFRRRDFSRGGQVPRSARGAESLDDALLIRATNKNALWPGQEKRAALPSDGSETVEGIRFLNEGITFLNCDWACLRASSSGSLFYSKDLWGPDHAKYSTKIIARISFGVTLADC